MSDRKAFRSEVTKAGAAAAFSVDIDPGQGAAWNLLGILIDRNTATGTLALTCEIVDLGHASTPATTVLTVASWTAGDQALFDTVCRTLDKDSILRISITGTLTGTIYVKVIAEAL